MSVNAKNIPVYSIGDEADLNRLALDVRDAYAAAAAADAAAVEESEDDSPAPILPEEINVPASPDLIGIDPAIYRQIQAALRAGKRHLMLYGPPGTGKTELARHLAGVLHLRWRLITGSADWTSQDIIGGYQPMGEGRIEFLPGILLREFDRPLVIDELNRCDIDKVIGPLFTVLSGQATTLPYRVDVTRRDSEQYMILPQPKPGAAPHEFAPSPAWRIIATINSIDKASLYQMSYALMRRFAWVYVDAPSDLTGFLVEFLRRKDLLRSEFNGATPPLVAIWQAVNAIRTIGPAPIIDVVNTAAATEPELDFLLPATPAARQACVDGLYLYLLPMLDGIRSQEAQQIAEACIAALGLAPESAAAIEVIERLRDAAI
jgi:MoxR-like ATPase